MKPQWLPQTMLRAASLLAPDEERTEWVREWQSELWYVPRHGAARFCLGAFRDALWLRLNNPSGQARTGIQLESPLRCLAFLASLALMSNLVAFLLPGSLVGGIYLDLALPHPGLRDLAEGWVGMLMVFSLLLLTMRLVLGGVPALCPPTPWANRLRGLILLVVKIVLLQPCLFGGVAILARTGCVPLVNFGLFASSMLACRWTLVDQRRRCPVCLRLLANPVCIGTPSDTSLEWYGTESICSRGHLLHSPEIAASHSSTQQWLSLDASWQELFPEAAGARRR